MQETLEVQDWIDVFDKPAPKEGRFLACDTRQGDIVLVAWYTPVHNHFLYTGGHYLGTIENPKFTHWMTIPTTPSKK